MGAAKKFLKVVKLNKESLGIKTLSELAINSFPIFELPALYLKE